MQPKPQLNVSSNRSSPLESVATGTNGRLAAEGIAWIRCAVDDFGCGLMRSHLRSRGDNACSELRGLVGRFMVGRLAGSWSRRPSSIGGSSSVSKPKVRGSRISLRGWHYMQSSPTLMAGGKDGMWVAQLGGVCGGGGGRWQMARDRHLISSFEIVISGGGDSPPLRAFLGLRGRPSGRPSRARA